MKLRFQQIGGLCFLVVVVTWIVSPCHSSEVRHRTLGTIACIEDQPSTSSAEPSSVLVISGDASIQIALDLPFSLSKSLRSVELRLFVPLDDFGQSPCAVCSRARTSPQGDRNSPARFSMRAITPAFPIHVASFFDKPKDTYRTPASLHHWRPVGA
jgi:hypothetical protein